MSCKSFQPHSQQNVTERVSGQLVILRGQPQTAERPPVRVINRRFAEAGAALSKQNSEGGTREDGA